MRDLYPPPSREIAVEVELLLQLQRLVAGVGLPPALPLCKHSTLVLVSSSWQYLALSIRFPLLFCLRKLSRSR